VTEKRVNLAVFSIQCDRKKQSDGHFSMVLGNALPETGLARPSCISKDWLVPTPHLLLLAHDLRRCS
jgi:hypothetical protein